MFSQAVLALSALGFAAAVRVTGPTSGSVWASGTSAQTVTWESVSTDATSFVIQLVNQAGYLPNSPVTLATNVQTSAQSTSVTYPGGTWPVGVAFQINLVTSTAANQAILAQSPQFNISNTGAAANTGTAPTTVATPTLLTTTPAGLMTTGTTTVFSTAPSGDVSGGIPNVASSRAAGIATAAPTAFTSVLLAAAAFFGLLA